MSMDREREEYEELSRMARAMVEKKIDEALEGVSEGFRKIGEALRLVAESLSTLVFLWKRSRACRNLCVSTVPILRSITGKTRRSRRT